MASNTTKEAVGVRVEELVAKLGAARGATSWGGLPSYVVHPRLCAEIARGHPCTSARCSYAHSVPELVGMWAQVTERVVDELRCGACIEAFCGTNDEPLDTRCVPLPAGSGASCAACHRADGAVAVGGGSSGAPDISTVRLFTCASIKNYARGTQHFEPIPPTPRDAESIELCDSGRGCADGACSFAHSPVVLAVWLREASRAAASTAIFDESDGTVLVAPAPTLQLTLPASPMSPSSPSSPHSPRRRTVSPISILQPLSPGGPTVTERCDATDIVPRRLFAAEDEAAAWCGSTSKDLDQSKRCGTRTSTSTSATSALPWTAGVRFFYLPLFTFHSNPADLPPPNMFCL